MTTQTHSPVPKAPRTSVVPTATETSIPHVWALPDGMFSFTDETGRFSDVIYPTVEAAVSALTVYSMFVLEGLGELLKQHEVSVTFRKADGTLREMRCTSNTAAFPIRESTEPTRGSSPDVQIVMDLDKNAIRSFRRDSVVSFNVERT